MAFYPDSRFHRALFHNSRHHLPGSIFYIAGPKNSKIRHIHFVLVVYSAIITSGAVHLIGIFALLVEV